MTIVYLYYHKADLDGYVGGHIIKNWILDYHFYDEHYVGLAEDFQYDGERRIKYDLLLVRPYNYGDNLDKDINDIENLLKSGSHEVLAYFVDCCPYQEGDKKYFEKFHALLGEKLCIIDHHATALRYMKKFEEEHQVKISGNSFAGYSGCELAAKAVYGDKYTNKCVELLGIYDMHLTSNEKFDWESEVMPFQYWLRTKCPNLEDIVSDNKILELFLDHEYDPLDHSILAQGEAILGYLKTRNAKVFKNSHLSEVTFKTKDSDEIEKRNVLWVADYHNNSTVFSDNGKFDDPNLIYAVIEHDLYKDCYIVSLYTTKQSDIDVGSIAEKMGGGGHLHAAGFKATSIHNFIRDEKPYESILHIIGS
jgi:hypothetical protein